jgi:hypothetical protein
MSISIRSPSNPWDSQLNTLFFLKSTQDRGKNQKMAIITPMTGTEPTSIRADSLDVETFRQDASKVRKDVLDLNSLRRFKVM